MANLVTIIKKEITRIDSNDPNSSFLINMVVEYNSNEALDLKFLYNPSKDSPASVANEMAKELSFNEAAIPEIQEAIQRELNKQIEENEYVLNPESTNPMTHNKSVETENDSDTKMNVQLDNIAAFAMKYNDCKSYIMDGTTNIEELNKGFIMELSKLAKRYKMKKEELEASISNN